MIRNIYINIYKKYIPKMMRKSNSDFSSNIIFKKQHITRFIHSKTFNFENNQVPET